MMNNTDIPLEDKMAIKFKIDLFRVAVENKTNQGWNIESRGLEDLVVQVVNKNR